jgi:tetratricopeptide (TPR) repeat protein
MPQRGHLGERLRSRRVELGLSQADLAGGELSPSYISLLEAGKRTPTTEVLARLAERLDCTVTYLTRGEDPAMSEKALLTLRYAELALRNGEAQDALNQLSRVLGEPEGLGDEARWHARRLHSNALEAVGRLEEALDGVEELRAEATRIGRHDEHLRLTIDAVRLYQEVGDVERAVEIGQDTLDYIEQSHLRGSDEHAQLASAVIGSYYERGDVERAKALAEQTIAEIGVDGSRTARGAVYWNASLAAEAAGDLPAALLLAERAIALYSEQDDARSLGRLRTAYGWLLLRSDPTNPDEALDHLNAAREQLIEVGTEIDLAYCETEIGRAELLRGDPQSALDYARSAAERLGTAPRLEHAHTRLVEGRALLRLNRRKAAIAAYRQAALVMTGRPVSRQDAAVWRELADAFTELGLYKDATIAYQQALLDAGIPAAPDASEGGEPPPRSAAG